jgi:hypothetical protein
MSSRTRELLARALKLFPGCESRRARDELLVNREVNQAMGSLARVLQKRKKLAEAERQRPRATLTKLKAACLLANHAQVGGRFGSGRARSGRENGF